MNILSSQNTKRAAVNVLNHVTRNKTSNDLLKPPSSEDDSHVDHPVLNSSYSIQKSATIHHLVNLSKPEFMNIYEMIKIEVITKVVNGKGQKN